jgi:hypothetical protein
MSRNALRAIHTHNNAPFPVAHELRLWLTKGAFWGAVADWAVCCVASASASAEYMDMMKPGEQNPHWVA